MKTLLLMLGQWTFYLTFIFTGIIYVYKAISHLVMKRRKKNEGVMENDS